MLAADDGVTFPIAQASAAVDNGRTLIDGNPANQLASAVPAAGVALPLLLLAPEMPPEISALGLVGVNVKIDPFRADFYTLLLKKRSGSLLRAQIKSDKPLDMFPVCIADSPACGGAPPLLSKLMGLGGSVAAQAAVSSSPG